MTSARPLDILDGNYCSACTGRVTLLAGVGWVHQILVAADHPTIPPVGRCATPMPHRLRCPACLRLVDAWGQRIMVHMAGLAFNCPGSRERGVPPLPEHAAFAPPDLTPPDLG